MIVKTLCLQPLHKFISHCGPAVVLAGLLASTIQPAFAGSVAASVPNTEAASGTLSSTPNDTTGTKPNDQPDALAPISIEADSAEQNEKLGITTYNGNVAIIQGALSINADRVQIITRNGPDKRSVEKISASGNPAIFTHHASDRADSIIAEAQNIDYHLQNGTVLLENKATLVQQGSSVAGDRIEYFIAEKRVKAQANEKSPQGKKSRVRTVITPGSGILFNPGD